MAFLSPPLFRRWRSVFPELARSGATPHKEANSASLFSLSRFPPPATARAAAETVPHPKIASSAGAFASRISFILPSTASASRSWRSQALPKAPRARTTPSAPGSSAERALLRSFLESFARDLLRSSGAVTIRDFAAFIIADVARTRRSRAIMSCRRSSVQPNWSLGFDRLVLAITCRAATSASAGSLFGRPGFRLALPGTITSYTQYPSSTSLRVSPAPYEPVPSTPMPAHVAGSPIFPARAS